MWVESPGGANSGFECSCVAGYTIPARVHLGLQFGAPHAPTAAEDGGVGSGGV